MMLGLSLALGASSPTAVAAAWTPADYGADLLLWLRADTGVTDAGGGVCSVWADQSGNGRDMSAAGAARPTINASDANYGGEPSLSFDGTAMTMAGAAWGAAASQPVTWLVVARNTEVVGGGGNQRQLVEGVGGNRHVLYHSGSGTTDFYAGATVSNGPVWGNDAAIVVAEANGASFQLFKNGFATADKTGDCGALTVTGVRIGSFNGASNYWKGSVAEVLCVQGASLEIRQAFVEYAAARYVVSI